MEKQKIEIGTIVETSLGMGVVTTHHTTANLWAVDLDNYIGQEWFNVEEIEIPACIIVL